MHTRRLRRLAALSALAAALFPASAGAAEHMPSGGMHVSATFGPKGMQVGWGVHFTEMILVQGDPWCANLGPPVIGLGPTIQVGLRGLEAPRLVAGLTAGIDPTSYGPLEGVALEGGLTIPLGSEGRIGPHGGVLVSTTILHSFARTAPGMDETVALGMGASLPGLLHTAGTCVIGRPARGDDGTPVTAPVRSDAALDEVAATWADDARMECDSIPAFLGLASELLELGAPGHLVDRALNAAEEEIRHAVMAARMARRLGGEGVWPVLPEPPARSLGSRGQALSRLAVEGIMDGAVGEGAAADEAEQAHRAARTPEVAAHYAQIAVEERRHAHLGWDIAAWALRTGGDEVRAALLPLVEVERADVPEVPALPERLDTPTRALLGRKRAAVERGRVRALLG